MNYYTLRIAIIIITTIIVALITVFCLKKSLYKKDIIMCYFALVFCFAISFPIEKFFIRFKTPTQVVKYYHPISKIRKEYIYDEYAYIYYKNHKGVNNFDFFIKKNNGWKKNNSTKVEAWNYKKYTFVAVKSSVNDSVGIVITSIDKIGTEINISDNMDSDFAKFVTDVESEGLSVTKIITVINKKKDENYILYLDGEEYNPL